MNFKSPKVIAPGLILAIAIGLLVYSNWPQNAKGAKASNRDNVNVPSIVNGDLVLPKVAGNGASNLDKLAGRVSVISANLVPIFDSGATKLTGIRILGEMQNLGEKTVTEMSPVIKFFNASGEVVGQKVGRLSDNFSLVGAAPQERQVYDITVDDPPVSDKLEIVLNSVNATTSADFEQLKIASRSMEVKTAVYKGKQEAAPASDSAESSASGEKFEYYTVSGSVVNGFSDPVTDIIIYAWVKDKDGLVFTLGRKDFRNDLLNFGSSLDFKINLLPLKTGESMESYEVGAWGRRYKLNL